MPDIPKRIWVFPEAEGHDAYWYREPPDWAESSVFEIAAYVPAALAGWQPIETAPKDGTRFLAAWPDGRREIALWSHNAWWSAGTGWLRHSKEPTDWQPLPEPPKKAG